MAEGTAALFSLKASTSHGRHPGRCIAGPGSEQCGALSHFLSSLEPPIPRHPASTGLSRAEQLLQLTESGVAVLFSDGRLEPHNDAMLRLLRQLGAENGHVHDRDPLEGGHADLSAGYTLDDLQLDPEDYREMVMFLGCEAPEHHTVVRMRAGGGHVVCAIRLQREADGSVLAAFQDQTFSRAAALRLGRLERFRCFGRLSDGLVHDLNNLLGSMLAMVDHSIATATEARDVELMRSMRSGTRDGARLLQQIGKMMRRDGPSLDRFSLAEAMGDAFRMVSKSGRLAGTEVTCRSCGQDPFVRGNAQVAVHLLCELSARMIGTAKVLHYELGTYTREPQHHGLPARQYGTVSILVDDMPPALQGVGQLVLQGGAGLLDQIRRWERDGAGLLAVMMGLMADGGLVDVVEVQGADLDLDGVNASGIRYALRIGVPLVAAPELRRRGPEDPPLEMPAECMPPVDAPS